MNLQFFKNLKKFDIENPEHQKNLMLSLQMFMALPDHFIPEKFTGDDEVGRYYRKLKAAYLKEKAAIRAYQLQEFGKPGDFPASVLPVIEKFHAVPDYDNGFEQIFDIRNYAGSKRNGFEIRDVESGLTFQRAQQGDPIQVYQMSGTHTTCYFNLYGGALSWSRLLFDDEDYWTVEDNAKAFVSQAYSFRAQAFYALLEAVAAVKGCCEWPPAPSNCADCDAIAWRDALAMNLAARTILTNCVNKGYGINANNVNFIVLTPIHLRGRIRQALSVNLQRFSGSEKIVDYSFTQITSLMLTNNNRFFVILPKKKLKGGYRMDLTLFSDFDVLTYADVQAGWMRYGGCVADTDQIECVDVTLTSGSC